MFRDVWPKLSLKQAFDVIRLDQQRLKGRDQDSFTVLFSIDEIAKLQPDIAKVIYDIIICEHLSLSLFSLFLSLS